MKNITGIKRTILMIAAVVAVIGIGFGGTYAFLRSNTSTIDNKFVVGSVETYVEENTFEFENATTISKNPWVHNRGKNPCYIRARVIAAPDDVTIAEPLGRGWSKGNDGYYYYSEAVEPGQNTTSIFTKVNVPQGWVTKNGDVYTPTDDFKEFEISVYQEAVQSTYYDAQGKEITDAAQIWAAYDASTN